MEMVPENYLTAHDKDMQRVLAACPDLLIEVTILTNRYRELLSTCLEEMQKGTTDTADLTISRAKADMQAQRLSIPLIASAQGWVEVFEHRRKGVDGPAGKEYGQD